MNHQQPEIPMHQELKINEDQLAMRLAAEVSLSAKILANVPKFVAIFGGSRVKETDKAYIHAKETAELLVKSGYPVVTGGGPGIMAAGNEGAFKAADLKGEQRSVGLNIVLPFEQAPNPHQHIGLNFHQFASRKVVFCRHSSAFILFPGGFGTIDELSEVLTLIQTKKMEQKAVVLYDSQFWKPGLEWIKHQMLNRGLISEIDMGLMTIADTPEEAVKQIQEYRPIAGY